MQPNHVDHATATGQNDRFCAQLIEAMERPCDRLVDLCPGGEHTSIGNEHLQTVDSEQRRPQRRRWGATNVVASDPRRRRWGKGDTAPDDKQAAPENPEEGDNESSAIVCVQQPGNVSAPAVLAAMEASIKRAQRSRLCGGGLQSLGIQFAQELFQPRSAALSYDTRGDLTALGQTSCIQTTQKLFRDFARIAEGNAIYWPECVSADENFDLFKALHEELAPWHASPYKRSRHPACVEEAQLLASPTYRHVVAVLRKMFGIKVGYSIVNLYADGNDWTEYHRDNYKAEGNRMSGVELIGCDEPLKDSAASAPQVSIEPSAHNVTVGASFGAPRELRFKHLQTGLEFGFPQGNGDVFAFTEPVNSAFQHCIPRKLPASSVGPRISVILWGRTDGESLKSCFAVAKCRRGR